jgi:two-component system, OmpR family, response regulator
MFKVLIIHDDPSLRTLLSLMLSILGYTACEAADGTQGERIAAEWHPDAILLDDMMPVQDGFVTCANIRRLGYAAPIILISGVSTSIGMSDVRSCGANDFLPKPVSISMLRACLNVQLQARIG